jgi:hypothetical protein
MGREAEPAQIASARADELVARIGRESESRARRATRQLGWVTAALGAAAAIVVAVRFAGNPVNRGEGGFTARGGDAASQRDRGVRAFCLGRGDDGGAAVLGAASSVRAGAQLPSELRCRLDGSIQFAYTLGPGAPEYLAIFGKDDAGHTFQYEPAPSDARATPLRAGVNDEPLASSLRLGVNHRTGRVHVTALFAERPVDAAALRRMIESGRTPGRDEGVVDSQQLELSLEP